MSEFPASPASPDDRGFVQRGFLMLGAMTVLVLVVLGILLIKPGTPPSTMPLDLPAEASAPGWQVRYNAAVALARRGSSKTPWPILREMLDEKQQLKNFAVPSPEGLPKEIPDEASARGTVVTALQAIAEWHRKQADVKAIAVSPELREVIAAVERLALSSGPEVKHSAEEARKAFVASP